MWIRRRVEDRRDDPFEKQGRNHGASVLVDYGPAAAGIDVDSLTLMVIERGIERTILIVFAGVSLILGYRLFKLGIINQQSGTFDWGKTLSVKLLNVGPGIFFALFGTVVLGILGFRGFDYSSEPIDVHEKTVAGGNDRTERAHYENPVPKTHLDVITDDDARGINTVIDIVQGRDFAPPLGDLQKQALQTGIKRLTLLIRSAAFQRYPKVADKYQEWSKKASTNPQFLDSLSDEDRKEYKEMKAFLKDSYLESGQ